MKQAVRRIKAWCPSLGGQRGQAIIIVTFAFVGLLAMVGLVTDAAVLFVHYDHLRRAVDAAAVAAVGQYREGRTAQELYDSAAQLLQLQLPGLHNVRFYWCDEPSAADTVTDFLGVNYQPHIPSGQSGTLCQAAGESPRKRVRIEADLEVNLFFLRFVWGDSVTIHAQAEAEAAVLNMVLLLDTSESMAYTTCDPSLPEPDFFTCLEGCVAAGNCQPFDGTPSVRWAAHAFVNTLMRDGVDQFAVYHLDKTPVLSQSVESFTCLDPPTLTFPVTLTASSGVVIPLTTTKPAVLNAITDTSLLNVYVRPPAENVVTGEACNSPTHVGGWWGEDDAGMAVGYGYRWGSTNIGGGLREAVGELVNNGSTDAAVWVIVLLSDGAANTTDNAADDNEWWTCPAPSDRRAAPVLNERSRAITPVPSGTPTPVPFCRDPEASDFYDPATVTRHCPSLAACTDPNRCDDPTDPSTCWYTNWGTVVTDTIMWQYDADDYARDIADLASSQQIAVYTIGFGNKVIAASSGRPDAGERLLRYIADVGDDGNLETAPCGSDFYWDDVVENPIPGLGESCGNYYYAPDAAALQDVLEDIASRIFSRITQ